MLVDVARDFLPMLSVSLRDWLRSGCTRLSKSKKTREALGIFEYMVGLCSYTLYDCVLWCDLCISWDHTAHGFIYVAVKVLRLPQYGIHVANRDNRTNMSRSSALSYNRSPKIILSSVLTLESHILTNESQPFKHPQLPNQLAANLFNLTSPINNTLKCRP